MPLLSIALVILNGEDTIARTLDSIASQKFKDFEVLVIDGKSSDNTIKIIQKYKNIVSLFVSEEDSGIYDAMNKALKFAKGNWIIFLGSDDYFYSRDSLFKIFKNKINVDKNDLIIANFVFRNKMYKNYFNWRLLKGNSINHQSVFYNRRIYKLHTYDTKYKLASDYKLNLALYLNGHSCIYINSIVSVFSDTGLSTKLSDLSSEESDKVRIELLGRNIGFVINTLIFLKNKLKKILCFIFSF